MNLRLSLVNVDVDDVSGTIQVQTYGNPIPTKVEYFLDNTLMFSKTTPPFVWLFDTITIPDGLHLLHAVATYKNGRTETTPTQSIRIFNSTNPPADVTAPTVPGSFAESADTQTSITVTWVASTDAVGVAGYNLYKNGVFVAKVLSGTTYEFTGLTCGTSYTLAIEAYDAAGNTSAKSTITAATENCPAPVVPTATSNIESNDTVTIGDTWTVTTDPDVELVEFWANGIQIGTDSTEPYSTTINLAAGVHTLGLVVTYQGVRQGIGVGGVFASNVTVQSPPVPPPPVTPVVTSSTIANGQTVAQGDLWTVAITPTPTLVEFWADGTRFATDSAAPFSAPVNLTVGAHQLGLVATVDGVRQGFGAGGVFANITVAGTVPPPASSAIYTATFETGDFSEVVSQQESSANRIVITSTAPLEGTKSVLLTCGPADAGVAGAGTSLRAEMMLPSFSPKYAGGGSMQGKTTWVTWDEKLMPGWIYGSGFTQICQFIQSSGTYYPHFQILANGPSPGIMYVVVRGGTPHATDDTARAVAMLNPFALNTKYSFKAYHKWSTGSDGVVKVWINGVLRATINGPNFWGGGYESTSYMKLGIYRSASGIAGDSQLMVDNVNWYTSDPG